MRNNFRLRLGCAFLGMILPAIAAIPCGAQGVADDSLVFIHANLIDGISNAATMDATVVVTKGRIESIGRGAAPAGRGAVVDLTGHWLLPGFVDAHVHVGNLADAKRALRSGATTIGEAGVNHFADIGMRELNHKGVVDVPDVVAAGYHIRTHPADDYFIDFPQDMDLMGGVHGTEAVRRMVQRMASRGVNRIKVMATERAGTPDTDPRIRVFNDEELAAIVEEANKTGLWVVAHAHGNEGAAAAVRAGVHSIEHGTYLSDDTLRLMKEKGVYLDPDDHGARGYVRSRRRVRQSHFADARQGHAAYGARNDGAGVEDGRQDRGGDGHFLF